MKKLKILAYSIFKVLVMLIVSASVMVFCSFCLRFVIEFADELGYTDLWITLFGISFSIIYCCISWFFVMVLSYVLFSNKEKKKE